MNLLFIMRNNLIKHVYRSLPLREAIMILRRKYTFKDRLKNNDFFINNRIPMESDIIWCIIT